MAKRKGRPSPTDSANNREAAVTMELVRTPGSVIAERLGVTRQTVSQWRREPAYREAVDLPLEDRRRLVEEVFRLVLGDLALSYVESVLHWLTEPRSPDEVLQHLESAAKWAGVAPPVPDPGGKSLEDVMREVFGSESEDAG